MAFSRKILSALAVAGALFSAGCGDNDSSEDSASQAAGGNPVDRAFVADMIPHHESAVQMAQIAQRGGSSKFVKKLADDIVKTQNAEISTMRAADRRLKSAGVKEGSLGVPEHMMGMDDDPASLKAATPFDRAFIRMMIPHHEGAIAMAKAEIEKGKDTELKKLADDIVEAQQREIGEMREHLGEEGAVGEHGAAHGSVRPSAADRDKAARRAVPASRDRAGRARADRASEALRELPLKAQQPPESH